MSIKRTSGNRERVSTSGQGIVSRRPTHSASSIVSPSSSHAPSLSVLREFPSLLPTLCLALSLFVSLCSQTHTPLNRHTPPPFLSSSLFPPSPVSCHACHFLVPTHLLQVSIAGGAIQKGQCAPSEHATSNSYKTLYINTRKHMWRTNGCTTMHACRSQLANTNSTKSQHGYLVTTNNSQQKLVMK